MKIAKTAKIRIDGLPSTVLYWSDGTLEIRVSDDRHEPTIRLHIPPRETARVAGLFAEGVLEQLVEEVREAEQKWQHA